MSSTVRASAISALRELTAVLAFYAVLSIALSWPLAATFTTALTGAGLDALSDLWSVWHAVQALAGREPFFSTELLYFPAGASLLLHANGPLNGVLALPFWPLGPIAGYNGGLVIGLALTGGAMYVLAREIGCSRPASIFAGIVLMSAPIHLVGLRGHLAKVFLGLIPIGILALRRALDTRHPAWWAAVTAVISLAVLLHSPLQFVQLALAAPIFVLAALAGQGRRAVAERTLLVGAAVAVATGPLLVATARAAGDPAMSIDRRVESAAHQPDLAQFVLPPSFSALFGAQTTTLLARWNVTPEIETEVSVPLAALLLSIAAAVLRPGSAAVWLALFAAAGAVALGPTLRAFGGMWPESASVMPYSWVTMLPGLDFLRTPPRFMQAGFVGVAAAAAIGLSSVTRIARAWPLAAAASLLVLVQAWPTAWPTQILPPTPAFYADLATSRDRIGVLDLPVRPLPETDPKDYSARYQAYQLIHRQGIAAGYLSRVYARHPVSPCVFADDRAPRDVRVNGEASRCEPAAIHQLSVHGYRYVVWHEPSDRTLENLPGSWAAEDAGTFVEAAFGARKPLIDDALVRVWPIPTDREALPLRPVVELGTGWYVAEPAWRWAASPATITITAPRHEEVELSMSMRLVHDRSTGRGLGENGVLIVTAGRQSVSRPFTRGEIVRVALTLAPGSQTVTLALGAGNFRPSDFGEADTRPLSFAIEWLELTTR